MSANPGLVFNESHTPLPFALLLETLAALDVSFSRKGDALALKNGDVLSAELREECRSHKSELLSLCDRIDRIGSVSVKKTEGTPAKLPPEGVRWFSTVLDEAILLLPGGVPPPADTGGLVIYRPRELAALRGISPAGLRWLHQVKKAFPGEVTE